MLPRSPEEMERVSKDGIVHGLKRPEFLTQRLLFPCPLFPLLSESLVKLLELLSPEFRRLL